MANPFTLKVIPPDSDFCDRDHELEELSAHIRNRENVVLFSPRRYGKTSLIRRLQSVLSRQKAFTIYADFFMVTSLEDLSARIAGSVYSVLHQRESLLKKGARFLKIFKSFRPVFKPSADGNLTLSVEVSSPSLGGADLLEKVMEELGDFVRQEKNVCHIAFDEFQEITELKDEAVEGILRRHIQEQQASYFFVGSRRRILLEMFNQRSRPFYQSAIMYPLKPLPHEDLATFLVQQFKGGGKGCSRALAKEMSEKVCQYPYYAQLLAYNVFEVSGRTVKEVDIEAGFEKLLASERYGYEALVQGLTGPQIALLKALAGDPH
ncbi:ATP-binding protein, partial [Thermodesulfobacteriota bacterium]